MKNINKELMHPKNSGNLSTRKGLHWRMVDKSASFVGLKVDLTIHKSLLMLIRDPLYHKMGLLLTSKLISKTSNY